MMMDGLETPMKPAVRWAIRRGHRETYQFTRSDQDAYAIETLSAPQGGSKAARSGRDRACLP